MNGIDTEEWDPETDPHLPEAARFSAGTAPQGKAAAKALLQQRLGLEVRPDVALVGLIGRLTDQKGVDIVLSAIPALMTSSDPPGVPDQQARSQPVPCACVRRCDAPVHIASHLPRVTQEKCRTTST